MTRDWVLIVWMALAFGLDVFLLSGASYIVFWKGRSPLWFLVAYVWCLAPTLYKVLRKRYGIPEEE